MVIEAQLAPSSTGQVQAVEGSKKQKNPQQGKKGKKGKKQGNQDQQKKGPTCYCCGGQHVLQNCPEFKEMQQKCKKLGN